MHPQYRKKGIAKAFCEKALRKLVCSEAITVTTFREGDKADTGHRKTIKSHGFGPACKGRICDIIATAGGA